MIGSWGEVIQIEWTDESVQLVRVYITFSNKKIKAFYYRYLGSKVEVGDKVLVNTSGIDLGLGTGGYGFIMAVQPHEGQKMHKEGRVQEVNQYQFGQNHNIKSAPFPYLGRIIKMRYTPQQTPLETVECEESPYHSLFCQAFSLNQRMVLVGELHSMLIVMAALIYHWQPKRRIAYIMDDQAALHLGVSNQIRQLKKKGDLVTITTGQAMGGDVEAVNLYTALEAAVKVVDADDIVITQGPGVVGTRTILGFSGMQLVHWIHAISTLKGIPVVIPRISWADQRKRHRGLSEHTRYPLAEHTLCRAQIPYPVGNKADKGNERFLEKQLHPLRCKHNLIPVDINLFKEELERALNWYGEIRTMGRTYGQDPAFFHGVGAAFYYYRQQLYG